MLRVPIVFNQILALNGGLKSRGIHARASSGRFSHSRALLTGVKENEKERERERESGRPEPVKVDGIGSAVDPMEGIVESSAEG